MPRHPLRFACAALRGATRPVLTTACPCCPAHAARATPVALRFVQLGKTLLERTKDKKGYGTGFAMSISNRIMVVAELGKKLLGQPSTEVLGESIENDIRRLSSNSLQERATGICTSPLPSLPPAAALALQRTLCSRRHSSAPWCRTRILPRGCCTVHPTGVWLWRVRVVRDGEAGGSRRPAATVERCGGVWWW